MPRKPKPRKHQGWWVTETGGRYTKLAPVVTDRPDEGFAAAERQLKQLLSGGIPGRLTVRQAFQKWDEYAKKYYRKPDGRQTNEYRCQAISFRQLLELHGSLPVEQLRRQHVAEARQAMVDAGQARKTINQSVGRIKRAVRWMVEEGHAPDAVYSSVSILKNLAAFRTPAAEPTEVKPVDEETFNATLPHLPDPWRSVAQLQWLTGLRPGEACGLKLEHLRRDRKPWRIDYGKDHKTAHKGRRRIVILGEQAKATLLPWISRAEGQGRDVVFFVRQRDKPVSVSSYAHAVARACEKAKVPAWHPNRLRHSFGTRVRHEFGLEHAQIALGHAKADVTQVYAERNESLAEEIARRFS